MASIIIAESVAFLPTVYANCCLGVTAFSSRVVFQPATFWDAQSPYMRLIMGVPYMAISSKTLLRQSRGALSPSIRTAIRKFSFIIKSLFHRFKAF